MFLWSSNAQTPETPLKCWERPTAFWTDVFLQGWLFNGMMGECNIFVGNNWKTNQKKQAGPAVCFLLLWYCFIFNTVEWWKYATKFQRTLQLLWWFGDFRWDHTPLQEQKQWCARMIRYYQVKGQRVFCGNASSEDEIGYQEDWNNHLGNPS